MTFLLLSKKPKAVAWRPDPPTHQQPHAGSARRSAGARSRPGRRPIAAQRLVPGWQRLVRAGEASRGTAGEKRSLLRRHFLRVPQRAGSHGSRACRHFTFPSEPEGRGVDW